MARCISRVGVPLGQVLPPVVGPLTAGQRDLDLGPAVREVERQRHQRQPALARLADEPDDLLAVQQQLAPPPRAVVVVRALRVLRDVRVVDPGLAVLDRGEGLGDVRPTFPQRLHLGALQHQPGLVGVENGVVVARPAVLRDQLATALLGHPSIVRAPGQPGGSAFDEGLGRHRLPDARPRSAAGLGDRGRSRPGAGNRRRPEPVERQVEAERKPPR